MPVRLVVAARAGSGSSCRHGPGDGELDTAHPGVPAALSIAVESGQASFGVTFAVGHSRHLGDLRLHHRFGQHPHTLAQEVDVPVVNRLAHVLEQRNLSSAIVFSSSSSIPNSNDARMTRWPFHVSTTACDTNYGDVTPPSDPLTCPGWPLP